MPLTAPEAEGLLAAVPEDERLESWRLVHEDGTIAGRGSGGAALLESMAVSRPAGRALALVPARVLELGYGLVARNRGLLGRFVPDGPAPRRYP